MVETAASGGPAWRVAVTRDEADEAGSLAGALRRRGLTPVACPILREAAADRERLSRAAARLDEFAWVICASVRAVEALGRAMRGPFPGGVRTAAVGPATGSAFAALGVAPAPVVAGVAGADALWERLSGLDSWRGRKVLVLTTPGGRTALIDALQAAEADVEVVDAYRMLPRPAADIRRDWQAAAADALILASPRAAEGLLEAVGVDAVVRLRAVVAIGPTTARALAARGIRYHVPDSASFDAAADAVACALRAAAPAPDPGVRS